jgi:D-aminopeptidase
MARPRLRDLGITTGLLPPGPLNAITDIDGVRVGVATMIRDAPHVIRTGVTAIWPRGEAIWQNYCFAGTHSFNGNGEMTGMAWIAEQGLLGAPICITNTWSVGTVRDAISAAALKAGAPQSFHLPVAAETFDGWLSESERFPVSMDLAIEAIGSARGGPVPEGNVGGGTGMITHEFKGGTGTASRVVDGWTVGALVQSNYGARALFRVDGVPVGRMIGPELVPAHRTMPREGGSIIVVLGTDAPLLPIQCQRLARRATTGLAWVGGIGSNGSGDIFIAFSTGNTVRQGDPVSHVRMLAPEAMTNLFQAAAEATEEAILNAMVAAETMTGREGRVVHALPHDLLVKAMRGGGTR